MSTPEPIADLDAFAGDYSTAWTKDPALLLDFFDPAGTYSDMAIGTTYEGHDGITRFHRWMLKFAPDSVIEFLAPAVRGGVLYLEWVWGGSFEGALRLVDGSLIPSNGQRFSVPGIAACHVGTDGKLISHRDFWDVGQMITQLGAP
ncbi:nuclear transport factor 2 family protein [Mycolicibacterium sp. 050158]|uniref:nuclear transport factor 2 family protein n=1 Tax=Mycolicibacterium sp. 050158 TaxID=3090602 RepID=UPI00299EC044|nr:nuclear transport factor 2 family protein [Mycolicibacterium sp. 050158]MDX1888911.1 nuclear transport factor 2 family protein [Mycolicibacterium sp. 050158]